MQELIFFGKEIDLSAKSVNRKFPGIANLRILFPASLTAPSAVIGIKDFVLQKSTRIQKEKRCFLMNRFKTLNCRKELKTI